MTTLDITATIQGQSMPEELVAQIASYAARMPELHDLSPEQVDTIAQAVAVDELKNEMRRVILSMRINWKNEAQSFLADKHSLHTRKAYDNALELFFKWLARKHFSPADITPRLADDYIRDIRVNGKDADSCRLYIAAVSSFYTFLERRFDEIKNPFRGTKARPLSTWKAAVIPSLEEIGIIIGTAEPILKVVLIIIAETGMRIGGLYSLTIKPDGTMVNTTKGKHQIYPEKASERILSAIKNAKLDPHHPFRSVELVKHGEALMTNEERFTAIMKTRLARYVAKLQEDGKIKSKYSFHDFRHAYAEQNSAKGLMWVKDHLGQSSLAVTEKYMRNILGKDTRLL